MIIHVHNNHYHKVKNSSKVSPRELYADGLGEKGSEGDSYQKMLIANTQTIVEGLGGKYTPFAAK